MRQLSCEMPDIPGLLRIVQDNPWDVLALVIFVICWLGYEPLLQRIGKRLGVITKDLSIIRENWMKEMVIRNMKLFDSNLMGHAVNSATHFSSANLILIAAVAGVLFGSHTPLTTVKDLGIHAASPVVLQLKLALVLICLSRGLLNFIWAIRQMNYCAAAMGSVPENMDGDLANKFSAAMSDILEPAMSNFSQGVRGYYFSLAAAAWLFGPFYLAAGSICAVVLLGWRQSRSQAARGLRALRELLEEHPYPTVTRPIQTAAAQNLEENDAPHNKEANF